MQETERYELKSHNGMLSAWFQERTLKETRQKVTGNKISTLIYHSTHFENKLIYYKSLTTSERA